MCDKNSRNDRNYQRGTRVRLLNNVSRYQYVDSAGTDRLHVVRKCIFLRNNLLINAFDSVLLLRSVCDVV